MERNSLKRKWNLLFNDLKERWPDLTQSDIEYIQGDRKKLLEVVEKRRHISADAAEKDVNEFLDTLQLRQNIA